MTFVHDRELRETLYRAQTTRASGAGPGGPERDNRGIIKDVLALRQEKAKLLGFAHFADLATDDRMAKTGKEALAFVTMLRDRLARRLRARERRARRLRGEARTRGPPRAVGHLLLGRDAAPRALRLRRGDAPPVLPARSRDARPLRGRDQPLRHHHRARSRSARSGTTTSPRGPSSTRAESASARSISTSSRARRSVTARGWAASSIASRARRTSSRTSRSSSRNVTPPRAPGQPALLNHREVETLFHEFGHMMHHVLSEVPIRSLAGTRVVSDFVELPSMIMENWCWESEALDRFARHFETGAPIPADVKKRMLARAHLSRRERAHASARLLDRRPAPPHRIRPGASTAT